ncbi:MAG: rhodoquinone biosynthesis methyltransferase RquA [Burkholderiaceae bacterium]|jgi:ubiquinone/menaquinone biosynthesis C-methylase UbiE|nr:rhodoquinone biosynthesis methyltransferase RquA [Burkholderiaceae bacterium]
MNASEEERMCEDEVPRAVSPEAPDYLRQTYWWAYGHPLAVWFWDRAPLINLVLLGNYRRLVAAALSSLSNPIEGAVLQVANAYGQLVPRIQRQLGEQGRFDLVDVLPLQLENAKRKLSLPDKRIRFHLCDACALPFPADRYDFVLVFFLAHELPAEQRRVMLSEALRVLKPGGRLVLLDFHCPHALHPFRLWQKAVFTLFEPFADDMWHNDLAGYLPAAVPHAVLEKEIFFGGLYQKLIVTKEEGRSRISGGAGFLPGQTGV